MKKNILTITISFICLVAVALPDIHVAWDAVNDSSVAGVKVYLGTNTYSYFESFDAGNTDNYIIPNVDTGITYYMAATTYDTNGNESDFSNEAVYTTRQLNQSLTNPINNTNGFSFCMTNSSGYTYIIQATTNLVDWDDIATNVTPFIFIDTNSFKYSQRFYRTKYVDNM